jgi:hypothetical protein
MSHDFSKTDPKDAFLVAKNAFDANYDFYQSLTPQINSLHQLSIAYDKLLKDKNKNLLRIRSLMEEVFPEFLNYINIDTNSTMLNYKFLILNEISRL